MRHAFCCCVALLATALSVTCSSADVLTCFSRGSFDVNVALRDAADGVEFKGLSNAYAPHGAQVRAIEDQYAVDLHGMPYEGFSIDLDIFQYSESTAAALAGEPEHYPAIISHHGRDISIWVAGVERGDFDPQNLSITITLPSMEFVEIDRFMSLEEMKTLGYSLPPDAETIPGMSAINSIWFGNCRRSDG